MSYFINAAIIFVCFPASQQGVKQELEFNIFAKQEQESNFLE